jgi:CheY-like chemotaxis protein
LTPQTVPGSDKTNFRVLVVEDETAIAQVCLRVLAPRGYDVTLAPDGKAALTRLSAENFDICIIDIRTPHMSGEQLFHWILANKPSLARGIILTTGDVISGDTARFLSESRRPSLPKPFSPAELVEKIKSVIAGFEHGTT